MDRRAFIALGTGPLIILFAVETHPASKVYRVGYVTSNSASMLGPVRAAFREALIEHGFVEGRNIDIEWRFGDGDIKRLPALIAELVSRDMEVIVVTTETGALEARKATKSIPIVFMSVSDPVAVGLVESLAKPGGNVTGITNVHAELIPKRLALLRELVPGLQIIGILSPPYLRAKMFKEIGPATKSLGLDVHVEEVDDSRDFDRAFAGMKMARVGAVMPVPSPLFYTNRPRLVELSTKHRLPLMGWSREFAELGFPIAYGINNTDMARRAAAYVARILKGAEPADLPIEQPTKFELVINVKTAKALGLTIRPSLRLRADQVIE